MINNRVAQYWMGKVSTRSQPKTMVKKKCLTKVGTLGKAFGSNIHDIIPIKMHTLI